jgi:O-antigen ligase
VTPLWFLLFSGELKAQFGLGLYIDIILGVMVIVSLITRRVKVSRTGFSKVKNLSILLLPFISYLAVNVLILNGSALKLLIDTSFYTFLMLCAFLFVESGITVNRLVLLFIVMSFVVCGFSVFSNFLGGRVLIEGQSTMVGSYHKIGLASACSIFLVFYSKTISTRWKLTVILYFMVVVLFSRHLYSYMVMFLFLLIVSRKNWIKFAILSVLVFVFLRDYIASEAIFFDKFKLYQELFSLKDSARLNMWNYVAQEFIKVPIVGLGYGNFSFQIFRHPHNILFQVLIELGLLGIIIFVITSITVFRNVYWKWVDKRLIILLWIYGGYALVSGDIGEHRVFVTVFFIVYFSNGKSFNRISRNTSISLAN